MRNFVIWTVALILFSLLQPLVPGIAGIWLRVLVITAAFDVTHRISWRPHWQTGLRALAALGVSVLIDYQTALKGDAAKDVWTLLMAMNFGAFQTMFLMDRLFYGTTAVRFRG